METLRLKPRQLAEMEVENWDDDDFLIDGEDITFQSQSNSANAPSHRRDSHSSLRSDLESILGEEEKHVHLPGDDEKSTLDAITAAAKAGIPIPKNVPPSALTGGTIKRLGGRKIKKIVQEDWGDDLEFPDSPQALRIKPQDGSNFPEVLRQVSSSTQPSPSKPPKAMPSAIFEESRAANTPIVTSGASSVVDLDRFRDTEDDDDFLGEDVATIRVSKKRDAPKLVPFITPPTPQKKPDCDDDFEADLELPSDGTLRLLKRREIPKPPALNILDDLDWADGSLGTRFGGTRRDARSNRSSSVSAFSPSIASSITAESEDEALDGLVLPEGPVNFEERLQRRRQSRSPRRRFEQLEPEPEPEPEPDSGPGRSASFRMPQIEADKEDFLAGLDIGDGDVLESKKLTLHRNVQLKEVRPASPSRPKAAVSLKFTTRPVAASRLPRPMGPIANHERTHTQPSLEPVSESGGPILPSTRRSLSRLGHSTQSSIASLNTPTTPSFSQSLAGPPTPRRREIGQRTSTSSLRNEPTTTSSQLLRLKRSLPAMKPQSPARPPSSRAYERPPSRTDSGARPQSYVRPRTPVERTRHVESAAAQARKPPIPFVPAGGSASQSHNINVKSSRGPYRHDSEHSIEFRPNSRSVSRSAVRSPSPRKHRQVEKIAHEGPWHQLSKPRRIAHFGDGHELDGFDDLPTSLQFENKYTRQPSLTAPKVQARSKVYQNILPDRTGTPSPLAPPISSRNDQVPSFARDTAASRIARETSLAQRAASPTPLAPLTTQRVAQLSARNNLNSGLSHSTVKAKKSRRPPQLKPHLISNLNPPKESKMVKGMFYNPETFRWEGNDTALNVFDAPASTSSTSSIPVFMLRERENATPRPALIANFGASKGVQVVGGMVFDPQNMCWLKIGPTAGRPEPGGPEDPLSTTDEDEDVFKDIPDLEDHAGSSSDGGHGRISDIKDDWLVGEEFDVGPEFVRRQREEEERWKKKCRHWFAGQQERDDSWKWAIRDIVSQSL